LQRGVKPDVVAFNTAIDACMESGKWVVALELFKEMQTNGVSADMVTYNVLIDGFGRKVNKPDLALEFLDKLKLAKGLEPDVISYSAGTLRGSKGDIIITIGDDL